MTGKVAVGDILTAWSAERVEWLDSARTSDYELFQGEVLQVDGSRALVIDADAGEVWADLRWTDGVERP